MNKSRLFVLLLVMAYVFARRWSKPQLQLYGLSREVVNGYDVVYRYNGRDFRLTDNFGNVVKAVIA